MLSIGMNRIYNKKYFKQYFKIKSSNIHTFYLKIMLFENECKVKKNVYVY